MNTYLFSFIIAFLLSFSLTPLARNLAFKLNILDVPNARKVHKTIIPRLGGIAVFASFLLSCRLNAYTFYHWDLLRPPCRRALSPAVSSQPVFHHRSLSEGILMSRDFRSLPDIFQESGSKNS